MERGPILITAKYPGTCSVCSKKIGAGTPIYWDKGTKKAWHEECPIDETDGRGEVEEEDDGEAAWLERTRPRS